MLLQICRFLPILQTLRALRGPPPPLPPSISAESLFSHLRLIFPDFSFWGGAQKFIKNRTSIKPSQTLKNATPGWPKLDIGAIWVAFWHHFPINFPDHLNLVICNGYNAKTSFLSFQAFHFSVNNRSTNHVFSKLFLEPSFSRF